MHLIDELDVIQPNKDTNGVLDKLNKRISTVMVVLKTYLGGKYFVTILSIYIMFTVIKGE